VAAEDNLWSMVREATARALQAGALKPIRTRQTWIEEGGIRFLVRVVEGLSSKPNASDVGQKKVNPFLPYDPQMHVSDVPPRHVALLNKFQVVDQHLLLVTRQFEEQLSVLTLNDFQALCHCMCSTAQQREALAFYNGGREAGASQSHKHLQLVPLPLAETSAPFPLEPLLVCTEHNQIEQSPTISFAHSLVRFSSLIEESSAQNIHRLYLEMLNQHGLWRGDQNLTRPYNLILTRELMFLVPRVCECFHNVSLNALAFAGALLVKNEQQLEMLRREGPWTALRHVVS
jgi:ATP adenylyltransferase